jgi:hypothetical protein
MVLSVGDIEGAARMFAGQRAYCAKAGAETYVAILDGMIADLRAGGPTRRTLAHWDGTDASAYPLRILGALHRLALDGKAPALAALFPTAGGMAAPDRVWGVAAQVLAEHVDEVTASCTRPPQTNEVGRAAVLLGGFLAVAAQVRRPLRLLELGASAGLNLMWDRYRVNAGGFRWGDAAAALELPTAWQGPAPPLSAPVAVASRAACDLDPIDIARPEDRARLESYIWPDQVHRLTRLRAACRIAQAVPFRLDKADAADWLERETRVLPVGEATVVYHSIFRQYVPAGTRARLRAIMDSAGRRATADAPLAWLALEIADLSRPPELTLQLWPGGETRTLATSHHHGEWVQWHG